MYLQGWTTDINKFWLQSLREQIPRKSAVSFLILRSMSFQKVAALSSWAAKEAVERVIVVCLSRTVGVSGSTPLSCQSTTSASLPRTPPAHTKGWMYHQSSTFHLLWDGHSITRANAMGWWLLIVIQPWHQQDRLIPETWQFHLSSKEKQSKQNPNNS